MDGFSLVASPARAFGLDHGQTRSSPSSVSSVTNVNDKASRISIYFTSPYFLFYFLPLYFPFSLVGFNTLSGGKKLFLGDKMPQSSDEDTLEPNSPQNGQRDQNEQNGHADGGEKGEKGKQSGGPVGFWTSELKSVRMDVFKNWLITSTSFSHHARF